MFLTSLAAGLSAPSHLGPLPLRTAEWVLAADTRSVRAARVLVCRELQRWGAGRLVDDCSLIVSELVTNSIRHGGTAFSLRLGSDGTWVYGEVFDPGEGLPREAPDDLDATGGRGLVIVGALADEWGVVPSGGGGKTVWFVTGTDTYPQGRASA
ncbi:ATP-binding protein [Sphaerisporangium sp. TRM90804]|uniref:ATP-binding protein n=1 Tax=Sphaerisporangium sp. TRM90804 TaxID=3031113 RepID=UPI00244A778E|nr:ATP-binding protein [Sphaerisporangium sp. TRM90804]MDH2427451.1 ATP-binding protein [Sphaerisporangium sp. TRM90804]